MRNKGLIFMTAVMLMLMLMLAGCGSASSGEGEEAATESYAYDVDAEDGQITVVNPETGEIGVVIDLLEDGSVEVMYILDESSLSLFMTRVAAGTAG